MEAQYNWKTKFFRRRFEIFQGEMKIGELNKESLSTRINGEINGKKLVYKTIGFIKRETIISDSQTGSEIGHVFYEVWRSKARIRFMDKEYDWQFDNFWRSKWSVANQNGVVARFQARGLKGEIVSYTDDVLVLTAFFIRNYFRKKSSTAAAA